MRVYYSLFGHLLQKERLFKGLKKVWKGKGRARKKRENPNQPPPKI
ncbi:protein of unknown function [Vibrio tapetis subsp. tapetis]|uniref:Uncharacterized protein n=1 Tax=Vibrio tapetis subsp. tapetis TaxID=1671868 RepID=A0A2N8Z8S9_9VIBR|nr:protein of unknown function [Vibrio tapetis subsp. tapetis]